MATLKPKFRYELKSQIIAAGFKNIKEFADSTGIGLPTLSRVICGWEIPSVIVQRKISKILGIKIEDLKNLF